MIKLKSIFNNSFFKITIKSTCLLALLVIQSCASPPAPRPKAIIEAEYFLQQGTSAFYNDEYPLAASSFTQALKIYRSIDDASGMLDSYINLMETSLAIGNLTLAHQQLLNIETMLSSDSENTHRSRVTLLTVKLLFVEEQYVQAINILQPLLPAFNSQQQVEAVDSNTLNIISSMARLAVLTQRNDATLWLQRLRLAINQDDKNHDRFRALYLRILALQKQQEGKFSDSKKLLNEALSIYHDQAYRRGIAASLQQLANLEILQQNWNQADALLQRALQINLWTLNQREAKKVLEQLIVTNKKLNNDDLVDSFDEQLKKLGVNSN